MAGRKSIYLDNADRQAAHRRRQQERAAMAEAALYLYQHPTPDFLEALAQRLVKHAPQPSLAAVEVMAAAKRGVEKGLVRESVATAPVGSEQIDMAEVWAGQQSQ